VVDVEERRLRTLKENVRILLERIVEFVDGVTDVRRDTTRQVGKLRDDRPDVECFTAERNEGRAFLFRSAAHRFGETRRIEYFTRTDSDTPCLVGVRRADSLQRRADLVVTALAFGQRIVRLVPREYEVCTARHAQLRTRHAARLEGVDLAEQRRQVDDDTVADDRRDMPVEHTARNELQCVLLVADNDGVARIVATLVANDMRVVARQQVDDFRLALITPLGTYDNRDGH
jgi:hypothetical protein